MISTFRACVLGCVLIGFLAAGVPTWGAISPKAKTMKKPDSLIRGVGAVSGGQAGLNLSLLDLRRTFSKKAKTERLVMDFGGPDLKPKPGMAGYYHVELSYNPKRLVIDLPQILASQMTEAQILQRFKGSDYVKGGMLNFDRTSQTMQLVLELKKAANVRVMQVKNPKAVGKLVVDILPYKR